MSSNIATTRKEFPCWSPPVSTQSSSVTVSPVQGESIWLTAARSLVEELRNLPSNWDGYGSGPIREVAFESGLSVLRKLEPLGIPLPTVVPVTGGGFALEFQASRKRLDLEILPDGNVEYLAVDKVPGLTEGDLDEGAIPKHRILEVSSLGSWLLEL
jgi:hypothetical protein